MGARLFMVIAARSECLRLAVSEATPIFHSVTPSCGARAGVPDGAFFGEDDLRFLIRAAIAAANCHTGPRRLQPPLGDTRG